MIQQLIKRERLPATFSEIVRQVYQPICVELNRKFESTAAPTIVGINGCPGSGKSTMALFLKTILESQFKRRVEVLSIDDFYKTKDERLALARNVHPLFSTRGVPGTHDIDLALNTIANLHTANENTPCHIPRFDKAIDDRHPIERWESIKEAPEFIILEGWCIAATPQNSLDLEAPINSLEAQLDSDAQWRSYVNQQLSLEYTTLFAMIEHLIVLLPPTPDIVLKWRIEQETKLRESAIPSIQEQNQAAIQIGMSDSELANFVMHYERLIQHMHLNLPPLANTLVRLDSDRSIIDLSFQN